MSVITVFIAQDRKNKDGTLYRINKKFLSDGTEEPASPLQTGTKGITYKINTIRDLYDIIIHHEEKFSHRFVLVLAGNQFGAKNFTLASQDSEEAEIGPPEYISRTKENFPLVTPECYLDLDSENSTSHSTPPEDSGDHPTPDDSGNSHDFYNFYDPDDSNDSDDSDDKPNKAKEGIIFVDWDGKHFGSPITENELHYMLCDAAPELKGAPVLIKPSQGAAIWNKEKKRWKPKKEPGMGWHAYFHVNDRTKWKALLLKLAEKLGKSIDIQIAQGERIDYQYPYLEEPFVRAKRNRAGKWIGYNPLADDPKSSLTKKERERLVWNIKSKFDKYFIKNEDGSPANLSSLRWDHHEKERYRELSIDQSSNWDARIREIITGESIHENLRALAYGLVHSSNGKRENGALYQSILEAIVDASTVAIEDKHRYEARRSRIKDLIYREFKKMEAQSGELLSKIIEEETKNSKYEIPKFPEQFFERLPHPWPLLWENWQKFNSMKTESYSFSMFFAAMAYLLSGKYRNPLDRNPNLIFFGIGKSGQGKDLNTSVVVNNIRNYLTLNGALDIDFLPGLTDASHFTSSKLYLKHLNRHHKSMFWLLTEATDFWRLLKNEKNAFTAATGRIFTETVDGMKISGVEQSADSATKRDDMKTVYHPVIQMVHFTQPHKIKEYIGKELADKGIIGRSLVVLDEKEMSENVEIKKKIQKEELEFLHGGRVFHSSNSTMDPDVIAFFKECTKILCSDGSLYPNFTVSHHVNDYKKRIEFGEWCYDLIEKQYSHDEDFIKMVTNKMSIPMDHIYTTIIGICHMWDNIVEAKKRDLTSLEIHKNHLSGKSAIGRRMPVIPKISDTDEGYEEISKIFSGQEVKGFVAEIDHEFTAEGTMFIELSKYFAKTKIYMLEHLINKRETGIVDIAIEIIERCVTEVKLNNKTLSEGIKERLKKGWVPKWFLMQELSKNNTVKEFLDSMSGYVKIDQNAIITRALEAGVSAELLEKIKIQPKKGRPAELYGIYGKTKYIENAEKV